MPEYRRILLDGSCVQVRRDGAELVAGDGRRVAAEDAVHLPPVVPSKIVAVHLNHRSRVAEFGATLPPAPTYFHKPTSALTGHRGAVVRPEGTVLYSHPFPAPPRAIEFSPSGRWLAVGIHAKPFGIHLWDLHAGAPARHFIKLSGRAYPVR